jgi:hypothetical protein
MYRQSCRAMCGWDSSKPLYVIFIVFLVVAPREGRKRN